MAVVDTCFLIFSSLTFSLPHLSPGCHMLWVWLVPFSLPLAQTSMTASVYLTLSLSLERFFSVVHPLHQYRFR